jgi:hypothetical protein
VSNRGRGGRAPAARDANRRPTKAEKKEQARLEREEIQRRIHRRKRTRALGTGLVIGAGVIAVLVFFLLPNSSTGLPAPDELLIQATQAKTEAACGKVDNPGFYNGVSDPADPAYVDQTHIGSATFPSMPPFSTYPSIPPTSGPHNPNTASAGVYDTPPPMDMVLHSLEHGASVVWYSPDASPDEISRIKDFYSQRVSDVEAGQDRVIVAPYSYPDQGQDGVLPAGTGMALVAWHRLETCGSPSLAAAYDFTSQFVFPSPPGSTYEGEAPEAGGQM